MCCGNTIASTKNRDHGRTTSVFVTLVFYNAILIGVGCGPKVVTTASQDFFLAGRGLGAWVAAISASASSSSAWTLLGVSGAAYAWGLPALWIFPSTVGGFLLNWSWVAPRLKQLASEEQAVTLSEVVAPNRIGAESQAYPAHRGADHRFLFYVLHRVAVRGGGQGIRIGFRAFQAKQHPDWRSDCSRLYPARWILGGQRHGLRAGHADGVAALILPIVALMCGWWFRFAG